MPDPAPADPQGPSKTRRTQTEDTGSRSSPTRRASMPMEFLHALAWMQARSALSIEEALLSNTETLLLTWARRRHETLQEALEALTKGYFCGDAAEWRAIYAEWWSRSVEHFAADVGELGNRWTNIYRTSIGADNGNHLDRP